MFFLTIVGRAFICLFLKRLRFTAEHAETAEKNYRINPACSAISAVRNGLDYGKDKFE